MSEPAEGRRTKIGRAAAARRVAHLEGAARRLASREGVEARRRLSLAFQIPLRLAITPPQKTLTRTNILVNTHSTRSSSSIRDSTSKRSTSTKLALSPARLSWPGLTPPSPRIATYDGLLLQRSPPASPRAWHEQDSGAAAAAAALARCVDAHRRAGAPFLPGEALPSPGAHSTELLGLFRIKPGGQGAGLSGVKGSSGFCPRLDCAPCAAAPPLLPRALLAACRLLLLLSWPNFDPLSAAPSLSPLHRYNPLSSANRCLGTSRPGNRPNILRTSSARRRSRRRRRSLTPTRPRRPGSPASSSSCSTAC